ncbi:DUF3617 domain-containing protein [Dokdonella ginsengisoli]|uniref:DUF3617 domain-containing protein n=1 Tax=Dokdonella ginsengisoli TaxID=363846 RepID=A0ABV9QRI3_9GAMM
MKPFLPRRVVAAALFCTAVAASAAPDSGDRYRVTSKMQMAGMSMPAKPVEVCTARANPVSEQAVPKDKDCQVQNFRVEGSKASYHVVCTGKNAMTSDGEMETLPDGYRGSMKAQVQGQQITMSYEGKRIGGCDYASESPEAMGKALTAQACEAQLGSVVSYSMYVGPKAACPTYKAKFCANVNRTAEQIADPARFAETERTMGAAIWPAIEGCGGSRTAILGKACGRAESGGDLDFVGDYCPDLAPRHCADADPNRSGRFLVRHCAERARSLAAQQCEGRGYTAMQSSPYRGFCNSYAAERLRERNAAAQRQATDGAAATAPATHDAPAKKPSIGDRFKALKDRLGGG